MASVMKDGTVELPDLVELASVDEEELMTLASFSANVCGLRSFVCMPMELRPRSSESWLSFTRLSSWVGVMGWWSIPYLCW